MKKSNEVFSVTHLMFMAINYLDNDLNVIRNT